MVAFLRDLVVQVVTVYRHLGFANDFGTVCIAHGCGVEFGVFSSDGLIKLSHRFGKENLVPRCSADLP